MNTQNFYQNQDIKKISNCIEAQNYIKELCKEINGSYNSEWCKNYFIINFPRLTKCKMGRILLGLDQGDKSQYYYVPNPF
jgi:hypothetical protein